jgi:hypothetical protein
LEKLEPYIIETVKSQIEFGARKDYAILLGHKDAKYFSSLKEKYKFFDRLTVLEHPRYIMQYKAKKIEHYIHIYLKSISM